MDDKDDEAVGVVGHEVELFFLQWRYGTHSLFIEMYAYCMQCVYVVCCIEKCWSICFKVRVLIFNKYNKVMYIQGFISNGRMLIYIYIHIYIILVLYKIRVKKMLNLNVIAPKKYPVNAHEIKVNFNVKEHYQTSLFGWVNVVERMRAYFYVWMKLAKSTKRQNFCRFFT